MSSKQRLVVWCTAFLCGLALATGSPCAFAQEGTSEVLESQSSGLSTAAELPTDSNDGADTLEPVYKSEMPEVDAVNTNSTAEDEVAAKDNAGSEAPMLADEVMPSSDSLQPEDALPAGQAEDKAAEVAQEPLGIDLSHEYVLESTVDGRGVLDVSNASKADGANVQLYESNGTAAQRWKFVQNEDHSYTLINISSAKALDVAWGKAQNSTNIQQYTQNGTAAQKWFISWVNKAKGLIGLRSALGAGNYALDVASAGSANGTNIQLFVSNDTQAQIWRLFDWTTGLQVGAKAPEESLIATSEISEPAAYEFYLANNALHNLCMDVPSASHKSGEALQAYTANKTLAQGWYVSPHTYKGKTYYRVRNAGSGLDLTLSAGSIVPGSKVMQATWAKSPLQLWSFYKSSNSSSDFYLINAATHQLLSVNQSSLVAENLSSSYKQTWKLENFVPALADGTYKITSRQNANQALDVANGSWKNLSNIQMYQWNKTLAQRWGFQKQHDGSYRILNAGSCLYLGPNTDKNIVQTTASSSWSLRYVYGDSGFGWALIDTPSNKALTVASSRVQNGTDVVLTAFASNLNQLWDLNSVELVPDGWYEVSSQLKEALRLDVASGSTENYANVQVYTSNGSAAQRWHFVPVGNGWYEILSGTSEKALDVANGAAWSEANVQQYQRNGSAAQRWKLELAPGGLRIINASGKALDIKWGASASGTNVWQYTSNGSAAQGWRLKATTKPAKPVSSLASQVPAMNQKAQGMWSSTSALILVDTTANQVGIFYGSQGNWDLVKLFVCSDGAPGTPTPKGTFRIASRGYSFGSGYTCYYYTQFYGNYLFHSVLYHQGTNTIKDGRLGYSISHGCVRLDINDAYYIYKNIPTGTTVYTY